MVVHNSRHLAVIEVRVIRSSSNPRLGRFGSSRNSGGSSKVQTKDIERILRSFIIIVGHAGPIGQPMSHSSSSSRVKSKGRTTVTIVLVVTKINKVNTVITRSRRIILNRNCQRQRNTQVRTKTGMKNLVSNRTISNRQLTHTLTFSRIAKRTSRSLSRMPTARDTTLLLIRPTIKVFRCRSITTLRVRSLKNRLTNRRTVTKRRNIRRQTQEGLMGTSDRGTGRRRSGRKGTTPRRGIT